MEKRDCETGKHLKRIVIVTGPESVGKTTIACHLAEKFNAGYYPEFAREYIERLTTRYTYTDIENIAKEQYHTFCSFKSGEHNFAVFDTYLIITKVWFVWFAKKVPDWLDEKIAETKGALYLLCAPDIDWIPDSVREHGGDERKKLFDDYVAELEKFNLDYRIVTGLGESRNLKAVKLVEDYLKHGTK